VAELPVRTTSAVVEAAPSGSEMSTSIVYVPPLSFTDPPDEVKNTCVLGEATPGI